MADLAEAFEQHLRSLSEGEWDSLVARVRAPKSSPETGGEEPTWPIGIKSKRGLDEPRRRGYITDGKKES